jgi:hypothetical protein
MLSLPLQIFRSELKTNTMIKKTLLTFAVIAALLVITVVTVLIQPQLLRGVINSSAQRFAGLEVNISDIRSQLNPLRFEIDGLEISNPKWSRPQLLRLANINVALTENPFSDKPFWTLNADTLDIRLEQNEEGEFNWVSSELAAKSQTTSPEPASPTTMPTLPGDFNFNRISVNNINLLWIDKAGTEHSVYLPKISGERIDTGSGGFYLGLDYQEQHFELVSDIHLFDPISGQLGYSLALSHQDLNFSSEGKLVLTPDLSGSEFNFQLDLLNAEQLAALANTEIPALPKISFSSKLSLSPNYEFTDIVLTLNDEKIHGNVTVDADSSAIYGELKAASLYIDKLIPNLSADNTQKDPAEPAKNDQDTAEAPMNWDWLDTTQVALKLSIDTLNAAGWELQNFSSNITLQDNIRLILTAATITELANGREISDFKADISAKPLANITHAADLDLVVKLSQQGLTAAIEGKLNANGIAGTNLRIKTDAEYSKTLWKLAQLPWQEAGAISIDAVVKTETNRYFSTGNARMGDQNTEFDLQYSPASKAQVATLGGSITLQQIDLTFMSDPSAENNPAPEPTATKASNRLISKDPIELGVMQTLNADVSIALEDIDTGYAFIKKAKLQPSLQAGVLNLNDTTINLAGGDATLRVKFDSTQHQPSLVLDLKLDAEDYGKLGLEKAAGINGGKGGIRFNIDSHGNSPQLLAANMNGKLDIKITDLVAQGNALNLIGSDVLSETIDKLNPFSEKKTSTDIECIAIHFDGKNGKFISDDGIALETAQTKIIGTGNFDLGNEQLLFGVSPIARTGVGINVGAAAGLVRLGGTFSKPKIVADPSGMFTSGLSTGAAIYTGGLSLLAQGLLKRAIYAGSACDGAIDEIPTADELPEDLLKPPIPEAPSEPENSTAVPTSDA